MNAVEKLTYEIERVTILRERYRSIERTPLQGTSVNVKPVIAMMTTSIKAAITALVSDDAAAVITAMQDLQGFTA
jgi:hypothetical protein